MHKLSAILLTHGVNLRFQSLARLEAPKKEGGTQKPPSVTQALIPIWKFKTFPIGWIYNLAISYDIAGIYILNAFVS